jgi:signal transduction histidine kinase/CheY-like chemotaxis protein
MPNKIHKAVPPVNKAAATPLLEARLKLFYLMLAANVFKGLIYLYDALAHHHGNGGSRAVRLVLSSVLFIFILRKYPKLIDWGIHYAILATIVHIYYRVFNQSVGADVVALQAIFMVIISGFYGLGKKWGTVYTIIAFASLILCHYIPLRWNGLQPLPQQLNDLYVAVNCLVILMSHIYFHAVLYGNLRESKLLGERHAELAETKSNFLATMSHELRTPLNSVIGLAALLVSDGSNAKQREQLDMLKFSAEGLLTLINDILDINKLEAGKLELEQAPFDLARLLNGIAQGMMFKVEEKALRFEVRIDEQLEGKRFVGDAARMSQIIYNLVGNALKFTDRGRICLQVKILKSKDDEYHLRFSVEDSGIGISEARQKSIFEPFQQAEASTARKFGGTGLGLSIVKQLVERFGSEIKLKSTPGSGSIFYFDLVVKEDVSTSSLAYQPSAIDSDIDLSSLAVLLAEDNMMNIFFMKHLFKRWDIVADIAENGEEVLSMVSIKNYDIILMDMHMPIMDGIVATKRIRELTDSAKSGTYIVALTASVSDHIQARIKDYGMNEYLSKPFELEDLRKIFISRLAANQYKEEPT